MFGPLVSQFLRQDSPLIEGGKRIERTLDTKAKAPAALLFNDPTTFIRSAIDELMFRIAVQTAFNNTFGGIIELIRSNQNTTREADGALGYTTFNGTRFPSSRIVYMEVVRSVESYKTSFAFLGGAIAVVLLAVILVVPLFYGFWILGRPTTLSPLETATAMGAPLLVSIASSNSTAREIIRMAGKQRVQYSERSTLKISKTRK
jgi:hypothetical protein